MTSKKMIVDIQCLINEHYSDKEPLNESQQKSKKCFNRYCDIIEKDLEVLEILKKYLKFDLHNWEYFDEIMRELIVIKRLPETPNMPLKAWRIRITKKENDIIKQWLKVNKGKNNGK